MAPVRRSRESETPLPFAGVEDGHSDDFALFITKDYVVVGEFAVIGVARFLEVDVEDVGVGVVGGPKIAVRRLDDRRDQRQEAG